MTPKEPGRKRANPQNYMPDAETVAEALSKAQSMDDFFGKEGIFAKLFATTLEEMLSRKLKVLREIETIRMIELVLIENGFVNRTDQLIHIPVEAISCC